MRKTFIIFILSLIMATTASNVIVYAEPQEKKETNYLPDVDLGFDVKDPNFKQKVIEDVIASFSKDLAPLVNKHNVAEYTLNDLHKATIAIGKRDTHLESLISLFIGTSYGERRLYIISGQPTTFKYKNSFIGYFLYKEVDGTNVLKIIRRGEKVWEVDEVKKMKAEK
ncbi:hypothetical protein QFZ81_003848 [Paenibacillus sp. V4I9]|uniref:hypothetical protein n=1 Tax=Paenibacillus sp. V4I9 TaxID=3042308 RepID=UPI00277D3B72|nr:hypothetical protein [Paenibacillus sp. V4I9]MDQ0888760.1 hypothetical protein [Paenibacillus sp. V4I9]